MTKKKKITRDVPKDIAKEMLKQEKAFYDLHEEAREKIKEGYRSANLTDLHLYDGPEFKRSEKTGREQIICKNCKEVFVADINGDRMLFEDQNHRLLLVKFKEIVLVCNKCWTATRFSIEGEPDQLVEKNGKTYFGKYEAIEAKIKEKGIKNQDAKIKLIKRELLNW